MSYRYFCLGARLSAQFPFPNFQTHVVHKCFGALPIFKSWYNHFSIHGMGEQRGDLSSPFPPKRIQFPLLNPISLRPDLKHMYAFKEHEKVQNGRFHLCKTFSTDD